ncbi:MAG: hypothetical protein LBO69_08455 [Ignavibacteria bacterium]|jgi:hypothetical protein|nr:hypothetical protein [Ignavibacteria bacterium]
MEVKLEKIFIPVTVVIIILAFIGFELSYSGKIDSIEKAVKEKEIADSEIGVRNDIKILNNTFKTIQFTINALTVKIHKEISQNSYNILKNKEITDNFYGNNAANYDGYAYHYALFSIENILNKSNLITTSINNNSLKDMISQYIDEIFENNYKISSQLKYNQIVNRLVKFKDILYIISYSGNHNANGELNGVTVILIPMNQFIKITDYIEGVREVSILDYTNKQYVFNSKNKYNGINQLLENTKIMINGHINIEKDSSVCIGKIYYEGLDLLIIAKSEKYKSDYLFANYDIKTIISISCTIIVIIIIALLIVKLFISRSNNVINNLLRIENNLVTNNNGNNLKIIFNIKSRPNIFMWRNINTFEKFIYNIESYIVHRAGETKEKNYRNKNKDATDTITELMKLSNKIDINDFEKINSAIIELENNNQLIYSNINRISKLEDSINGIEILINIININVAILCNQLNDNRLNELLLLVNSLNNKTVNMIEQYRFINSIIDKNKIDNNDINIVKVIDNIKITISLQQQLLLNTTNNI